MRDEGIRVKVTATMMTCKNVEKLLSELFADFSSFLRVNYVDVFGRSRKIARKDLDKVKRQDEDLTETVESREEQARPAAPETESDSSDGSISSSESEQGEVIGPDIGLQFKKQREKWEEQDELNRLRGNLHYQDILYDGEKKKLFLILYSFITLKSYEILGLYYHKTLNLMARSVGKTRHRLLLGKHFSCRRANQRELSA